MGWEMMASDDDKDSERPDQSDLDEHHAPTRDDVDPKGDKEVEHLF